MTADLAAAAATPTGWWCRAWARSPRAWRASTAIGAGPVIRDRVAAGRPVLGICVGMQVLFDAGDEHGVVTKGLGLLPGEVRRLTAPILPHMGWNTVRPPAGSRLFAGLAEGTGSTSSTRTPPAGPRGW